VVSDRKGRPGRPPPTPRLGRRRPPGFDRDRYARRDRYAGRNGIERGFGLLKHWRGLATRYDKHARNYAGAITLATLLTWLP
jgi:transposase